MREPDERVFRVETSRGDAVYVVCDSEAVARNVIARTGRQAAGVARVRASEVPDEAELLGAPTPPAPLTRLERAWIIQRPLSLIVIGVILGNCIFWSIVFFIFGLIGEVRFG